MGNNPSVFSSCIGEGRRGYNLMPERSIMDIAKNLHEPGQGIADVPVEKAHTGLSPRLSHVVDSMRGTNHGSTFDKRPPESRHNFSLVERYVCIH
jgi:hypothetical protein